MMNNHDSLCCRGFKARFFPNSSILDAKDSALGSNAWKSILSARDVIKKGAVWRIGDGQSVSSRKHKCLPNKAYRKGSSPIPSIPPDAKVSSLIDANTGNWKANQINQSFLPYEARLILSIPLSIKLPTDCLIWSHSSSGCFNARSAYKLLISNALASNASSLDPNPHKIFWRGIWKLRVPSKVKHFVWRASNNALPTMDNLLYYKVLLFATCNICRNHIEDTVHAVWESEGVKEAWQLLSWANHTDIPPPLDFTNLISKFLQVHDRAEIFAVTPWLLWNRQNFLRLGKPVQPLQMLPSLAGGMLWLVACFKTLSMHKT